MSDSSWESKVFELCSPVPVITLKALDPIIDPEAVGRMIDNAKWHGLKGEGTMDATRRSSGYLDQALTDDLRPLVRRAKIHIPSDVDTLVGTGLSGALVVPHLGRRMGLNWGILRKDSDLEGSNSHADGLYEGRMGRRWILVDDFVSMGHTVQRVWKRVHEVFVKEGGSWRTPWATEFVGVYQYSQSRMNEPFLSKERLLGHSHYSITDPSLLTVGP